MSSETVREYCKIYETLKYEEDFTRAESELNRLHEQMTIEDHDIILLWLKALRTNLIIARDQASEEGTA